MLYVGRLGPLSAPMCSVFGSLESCVTSLGSLLRPLRDAFGRSWGICSLSYAVLAPMWAILPCLGPALRRYVGGRGSLLEPMLAGLATLGASVGSLDRLEPGKSHQILLTLSCAYFSSGSTLCSLGHYSWIPLGASVGAIVRFGCLCWRSRNPCRLLAGPIRKFFYGYTYARLFNRGRD